MGFRCNFQVVLCTKPFRATRPCLKGSCGPIAITPCHLRWGRGQERIHFPEEGKPRLRDGNFSPGGLGPVRFPFATLFDCTFVVLTSSFLSLWLQKGCLLYVRETGSQVEPCKWGATPPAPHPAASLLQRACAGPCPLCTDGGLGFSLGLNPALRLTCVIWDK